MELIVDLVFLAVSIFLFGTTYTFRVANIESGGGPAFWPRILLGVMIVLEIVLVIISYRKYKKGELKKEKDPEVVNPKNLYIGIGGMALYILLISYLGFLISTMLFMFIMMHILQVKLRRNIIVSVVGAYIISYVFVGLLMVPLPQGVSVFGMLSSVLGL
jgi:hypothetical protein